MSAWENERKRRMDKIIDLLKANPEGLTLQTIARDSRILTEITKNRLELYIEELAWSGVITRKRDGRIKLA